MTAHRYEMPTRTAQEMTFLERLASVEKSSEQTFVEKVCAFPMWAPRQAVARFLAQHEVFRQILNVHGSIVEGGVAFGAGVGAWMHFSSIYESPNHGRRVVAFDTFHGFVGMGPEEKGSTSGLNYAGGMAAPVEDDIQCLANVHSMNRPVGHIPKVELVKGDACETIPRFLRDNPHFICALLVLDFDVAAPTRAALEHFLPRMPRGGIVCLDELNSPDWPGETIAVLESGLLQRGRLNRFPFTSTLSYVVLD